MSYDNRILNINGQGDELLLLALKAAVSQMEFGVKGWSQSKEAGMMLHWTVNDGDGVHALPCGNAGLTAEECFPLVKVWLVSDFAKTVVTKGPDADPNDYDVTTEIGFRVYLPSWEDGGDSEFGKVCAIKPVHLWLGK
jgi:hypothetical protein